MAETGAEIAVTTFCEACGATLDLEERCKRYEAALQRIAQADEEAHPLVKLALEALHP